MSSSAAGSESSGSSSVFPGASSFFPRDAGRPEGCGSVVSVTEEIDAAGDKGSADSRVLGVEKL